MCASIFINNRNQCIAPFSSSNDNHWDMMATNWGMAKTSMLLLLTNNQLQHLDASKEATKEATKEDTLCLLLWLLLLDHQLLQNDVECTTVSSSLSSLSLSFRHPVLFLACGGNWQLCSSPATGLQRQHTHMCCLMSLWVCFQQPSQGNPNVVFKLPT